MSIERNTGQGNKGRKGGMLVVAGVALLALAGCAADHYQSFGPGYGDANRHNMASQIVNPDPPMPTDDEAAVDGRRTVLAVERYKQNQVIRPVLETTTTTGGGR